MTPTATIRRYRYGSPYPTEGAVLETPLTEGQPSPFSLAFTPGGAVLSCPLAERDLVLGLGQAVGPQTAGAASLRTGAATSPTTPRR